MTTNQAYIAGQQANINGLPYDEEESAEWQAGWDDAQVTRDEWLELCEEAGDGFVLE